MSPARLSEIRESLRDGRILPYEDSKKIMLEFGNAAADLLAEVDRRSGSDVLSDEACETLRAGNGEVDELFSSLAHIYRANEYSANAERDLIHAIIMAVWQPERCEAAMARANRAEARLAEIDAERNARVPKVTP